MTIEQIAAMCGYGVMIAGSVAIVFFVIWLLVDAYNDFIREASRAASESYWWVRWLRFERIAKARKNGETK